MTGGDQALLLIAILPLLADPHGYEPAIWDFSQVEADALQLAINEPFALFFSETRPFFKEGADTFSTPLNLVHTRTVVDPSVAIKIVA